MPHERVRRAQRRLVGVVVLTALLWAATSAMAVVGMAAIIDAIVSLPAVVRASIPPLMLLAAVAAAGVVLWRERTAWSIEKVALWIEEHDPTLRYALVTAIDSQIAPADRHRDLHVAANAADVEGIVRSAWRRRVGRALVSATIATGALVILQPKDLLRASGRELMRRAAPNPPAPMPNRLTSLSARIEPPAYSRLPAETLDQPASVAALIGSRVTFLGSGPPGGVTAAVGKDSLGATPERHGWAVQLAMPAEPAVVTLRDRAYKRLVALEPRTDSAPNVRLVLPLHDTTYQTVPRGRLTIDVALTDDIGLAYGYVEYLLSTGSEETFETKLITGQRVAFDNARSATLRNVINLDTMKLAPGSVLNIRAVAFDFNNVTGPGKGVSETRTLRVAEAIDSTSISAAPPLPIDSMWISQRLLNMKTDTLIRAKRKLQHEEFVHRSSGYSNAQEDIRKRALAVVALLEDNGVGGSFETEASRMLRDAADLMWTAREDLGVAAPDSAMPYMKKILAILDNLRLAHRYYLRGLLRPVAVDIERVRMMGKDTAGAVARKARTKLNDPYAALAARIGVAAALARSSPAAAVDSLTYIRVTALTTAPNVAGALRDAIEILKKGGSVDNALARTRRALEPKPQILGGPTEWGGVMP